MKRYNNETNWSITNIFSIILLLAALVLGSWHSLQRPKWSDFVAPTMTRVNHASTSNKSVDSTFLPGTGAHTVHAASLILLHDGNVRAFWFAGSNEGMPDVVIQSAIWDTKTGGWQQPTVVIDRVTAQRQLQRFVAKLGNPVPVRMADGKLALFFVTASIGGWATSSINVMTSTDEGATWGSAQRLITSPWMNLSTLVKSPAITFADSHIGLPVYHEFIATFGELLRIDSSTNSMQLIDKRRMSQGQRTLQPVIFIDDAKTGSAYFRQGRRTGIERLIATSHTQDAGYTWRVTKHLLLPNPNSAISGLILANGNRLLVFNDLEEDRYRLVLAMSKLMDDKSTYSPWQIIQTLEDDSARPKKQRRRFSYPYLLSDNNGDVHLVYTWSQERIKSAQLKSAIKHVRFSAAYLNDIQLKQEA